MSFVFGEDHGIFVVSRFLESQFKDAQLKFTCSKLTVETLEKCVRYGQSLQEKH